MLSPKIYILRRLVINCVVLSVLLSVCFDDHYVSEEFVCLSVIRRPMQITLLIRLVYWHLIELINSFICSWNTQHAWCLCKTWRREWLFIISIGTVSLIGTCWASHAIHYEKCVSPFERKSWKGARNLFSNKAYSTRPLR